MENNIIVLLVGPSGSGKSTVAKELLKHGFVEAISTTTRAPRPGELTTGPNRAYTFVSKETFAEMDLRGEFVETVEFAGNSYGVEAAKLSGKTVIVVEPHGAQQIIQWGFINDVKVFAVYMSVSREEQQKRMLSRGDSEDSVMRRVAEDDISKRAQEITFDIAIDTKVFLPERSAKIISDDVGALYGL